MSYQSFIILSILSLFALALAQPQTTTYTCANNPLVNVYNMQNLVLPSSIIMNDQIDYCSSLQGAQSCCNSSVLNQIGSNIRGYRDQVKANTTILNKQLIDSRNQIDNFNQTLKDFIMFWTNISISDPLILIKYGQNITSFLGLTTQLLAKSAEAKQNQIQISIQKRQCQINILKLQASLSCAACNPNIAGVSIDQQKVQISLSSQTCQNLSSSCYDFINNNYKLAQTFKLPDTLNIFGKAIDQLKGLNNGSITTLKLNFDPNIKPKLGPNIQQPDCANTTQCNFVCNGIIKNGKVDLQLLTLGGPVDDQDGQFPPSNGPNAQNNHNLPPNGQISQEGGTIRLLQSSGGFHVSNDAPLTAVDPGQEQIPSFGIKQIYDIIISYLIGFIIFIIFE